MRTRHHDGEQTLYYHACGQLYLTRCYLVWKRGGYEVFHSSTYGHDKETDEYGERAYPDGWYWWSCQPGCLPDGDPVGPFDSEEAAIIDCREGLED